MDIKNKLLIICGPTATGKTRLAIHLAKKYYGELISADSRQVYKGMDIGTGKDFKEGSWIKDQRLHIQIKNDDYELIAYNRNGIPIWMYDVVDPDEGFSVSQYHRLANEVIKDIGKRGKLPIIVGGTGLYIQSLLFPFETSHIPPNKILRQSLDVLSIEHLQKKLQKEDVTLWNSLNLSDRQNPRRLKRKIEIALYKQDNKSLDSKTIKQENSDTLLIGLTASYPALYKLIDERVEQRIKEGTVEEIRTLLLKGYTWDLPSMNTFGYKEWKEYFNVSNVPYRKPEKEIIQRWKWDEHGYARRQMVWFRKMKYIRWFDITDPLYDKNVEVCVRSWYT